MKKGVDFFGDSAILFSASGGRPAEPKRNMTDIEKKIQKLETSIILSPKIHSLDPIKDHRIKVNLFNIAREELLHKDLVDRCEELTTQHLN